tara:strand:+ start:6643 stop:6876 length:234 start_codon:yes stop_codon:yes gene_type:complete
MPLQHEPTDENYVKIFNELGFDHFYKASDHQLKKFGKSEEKIRQIKIDTVKNTLQWYSRGVELYKMLNEISGGKNYF